MSKGLLHLSIDTEIITIAKSSGLNLSGEFETWLKIRVGNMDNIGNENKEDTELLIAQHLAEVKRLQTKAEMEKETKDKGNVETATVDYQIEDMIKFKEPLNNPTEQRIHGLQFLFHKRHNKMLNPLEVRDMLLQRIKERGITEPNYSQTIEHSIEPSIENEHSIEPSIEKTNTVEEKEYVDEVLEDSEHLV